MSDDSDDAEEYTQEEVARRRDEVIRRMANTPPQHRSIRDRSQETAKKAAVDQKPQKPGAASRAKT